MVNMIDRRKFLKFLGIGIATLPFTKLFAFESRDNLEELKKVNLEAKVRTLKDGWKTESNEDLVSLYDLSHDSEISNIIKTYGFYDPLLLDEKFNERNINILDTKGYRYTDDSWKLLERKKHFYHDRRLYNDNLSYEHKFLNNRNGDGSEPSQLDKEFRKKFFKNIDKRYIRLLNVQSASCGLIFDESIFDKYIVCAKTRAFYTKSNKDKFFRGGYLNSAKLLAKEFNQELKRIHDLTKDKSYGLLLSLYTLEHFSVGDEVHFKIRFGVISKDGIDLANTNFYKSNIKLKSGKYLSKMSVQDYTELYFNPDLHLSPELRVWNR